MKKKLFTLYFLLIPIISIFMLTSIKIFFKNKDFFSAFEDSLPIIVFYYIGASFVWRNQFKK